MADLANVGGDAAAGKKAAKSTALVHQKLAALGEAFFNSIERSEPPRKMARTEGANGEVKRTARVPTVPSVAGGQHDGKKRPSRSERKARKRAAEAADPAVETAADVPGSSAVSDLLIGKKNHCKACPTQYVEEGVSALHVWQGLSDSQSRLGRTGPSPKGRVGAGGRVQQDHSGDHRLRVSAARPPRPKTL